MLVVLDNKPDTRARPALRLVKIKMPPYICKAATAISEIVSIYLGKYVTISVTGCSGDG